ncbi:MAG: molybdopterin molybdotransferase MoeA [Bdellovibrionaceae bacterium]|nr:molybdopterin molybdotransferase MoeA [Bdellovibrionales bacterium]MCB9085060.1 molybdopterin molybdotransferase MoeA [Pseudobdellovibrionaceae bacterium]
MISVYEAQGLIFKATQLRPNIKADINNPTFQVLAQDLCADSPLPPFDRVAMDGIAVCLAGCEPGQLEFSLEGIQRAGEPRKTLQNSKSALEVMTGAVLPAGCDTVIRYEDVKIEKGVAKVTAPEALELGKHIHQKGSDHQQDEVVVAKGTPLTGPVWAVAASVGCDPVEVVSRPRVAVISTGDELVDPKCQPEPHQIRRSNSFAIQASLFGRGYADVDVYHLPDEAEVVTRELGRCLKDYDVLVMTGGVSMGKFDFIPAALNDLQVREVFHKVRQKPGKPFWFGLSQGNKPVFALPGNPVSSLICLHRYVLPALDRAMGFPEVGQEYAILQEEVVFKKPLALFQPIKLSFNNEGQILARPVKGNGSGDFSSLALSDGFVELPDNKESFAKGEAYPLFRWRY